MPTRTGLKWLAQECALASLMMKVIGLFAVSCSILFFETSSVLAQSQTCRSLQAQLSQIETGRGATPSRQYVRYQRAVKDQRVQINKTERASRRNACNLRNSNKCVRIRRSLSQMYNNLNSLERTMATFAPRGGTTQDRARILRSMQRYGCNGTGELRQAARQQEVPSRRRTLLEQIFGSKTYSSDGATLDNELRLYGGGTYRTLCVRTCDGYYFPISFSTAKTRFPDDMAQCEQMCPGTETALFVHPMPGGDAETSISYRTGQPYSELTNAFSYRKAINPECSCRFKKGSFAEVAGAENAPEETKPPKPQLPVPTFRQDIALDEETLENAQGGMTFEKLAALATNNDGDDGNKTAGGQIRIVGPAFFPVQ